MGDVPVPQLDAAVEAGAKAVREGNAVQRGSPLWIARAVLQAALDAGEIHLGSVEETMHMLTSGPGGLLRRAEEAEEVAKVLGESLVENQIDYENLEASVEGWRVRAERAEVDADMLFEHIETLRSNYEQVRRIIESEGGDSFPPFAWPNTVNQAHAAAVSARYAPLDNESSRE